MDDGLGQQPDTPLAPSHNPIAPQSVSTDLENNNPRPPESAKPTNKRIIWLVSSLGVIFILIVAGLVMIKNNDKNSPSGKIYKVGILNGLATFNESVNGFEQGMSSLGYVKGKTIDYDVQVKGLSGNEATFKRFIADKDNLVVVFPTEPTQEAEEFLKGSGIPIVSLDSTVEGTNIVNSILQPGRNMTGVRYPGPEDSVERLDVLHEIDPSANKILVAYLKDYPNVPAQLAAVQAEAAKLDITIIPQPIAAGGAASYVTSLSATNPGFDAIIGLAEPFTSTPAMNGPLYNFANQNNIPIVGSYVNNDNTGPVAAVAPNSYTIGQMGATLADKIFKGWAAGSLPILTPMSNLAVNLKVASSLGITPDTGLLSTATQIIR